MKLSLTVNKPPNGHTFKANEPVEGHVQLQLDENLEAPDVRVILQGIAKITLKPGFDAKAQIGDTHRRLKVRISYSVTAVCRRPGGKKLLRLLLQKNVAACQMINYAPPVIDQLQYSQRLSLPPPSTDDSSDHGLTTSLKLIRSTAWLPASKLGIDVSATGMEAKTTHVPETLPPGCLPPYSPAMTLEVVMPYPPVITPGQPVALGLFLRTPRALLDAVDSQHSGLQLCSLSVRLRRQTQGRIGQSMRADDTAWPMWSVNGTVPIRQEKVDIAWGEGVSREGDQETTNFNRMLMGVPAAAAIHNQAGFYTCFASRVYSIEVSMGVTVAVDRQKSGTPEIQYAKTAMQVMVSEPPPDYEAGPEEE
ncbi:hypothetical protein SEUCBS140593_002235 [Sporothrix eucalyptigena]|uniref:Arrestin-like N-terminal domain-containing protein n=1 Tax=Sporothrix eucalyptigena TaxID=1812306 RepID=A0ABP0B4Z7_9PEZI